MLTSFLTIFSRFSLVFEFYLVIKHYAFYILLNVIMAVFHSILMIINLSIIVHIAIFF